MGGVSLHGIITRHSVLHQHCIYIGIVFYYDICTNSIFFLRFLPWNGRIFYWVRHLIWLIVRPLTLYVIALYANASVIGTGIGADIGVGIGVGVGICNGSRPQ